MGRLLAIPPPFHHSEGPRMDAIVNPYRGLWRTLDETVDERHLGDPSARRAFWEAEENVYLDQLAARLPNERDREIVGALMTSPNTAEAARALGMSRQSLYRAIRRLAPTICEFLGR